MGTIYVNALMGIPIACLFSFCCWQNSTNSVETEKSGKMRYFQWSGATLSNYHNYCEQMKRLIISGQKAKGKGQKANNNNKISSERELMRS